MEQQANKLFTKYKTSIIKKLGVHGLSNTEIDEVATNLLKSKYKGSFAQNEKFPKSNGYYIINTDISSGPGIHWLGVKLTPKTAYVYDSFGRDSKNIVPHLVKYLYPRKIVESKRDKEQQNAEIICGHLALSWIAVAHDLSIKHALKI